MTDNSDDRLFLARIDDLAQEAENKGYITFSDFLDDHKQSLLAQSVGRLSVCMKRTGGFEEAERVIAVFYPSYTKDMLQDVIDAELCLLKITLADQRFLKKIPEHRDYLGAILGTGIKREKVGDILLSEDGAYVWALSEIVPYLIQELTSVGAALVSVKQVEKTEMPAPPKGKEEVISVSSLRLDAMISHGFRMGRTEAAKMIRAGLVFRTGVMVQDPDKQVSEGDKLTLRGRGRLVVKNIIGVSRSGRTQVTIEVFGKK